MTRRAWPELRELFVDDAVITLDTVTAPERRLVGPVELGSFVAGAIERFDHFQFVVLNAVIDIADADRASGRVFMCEIRHDPAPDEWTTAYGLYQDDYLRSAGRWRFAVRRYRSLARTGPDAGVFGLPAGLGPLG